MPMCPLKKKSILLFFKIAVKIIPPSHPSSKRIKRRSQYSDACSSLILLQPEAKCLRPHWQLSLTPTNLLWAGALAQALQFPSYPNYGSVSYSAGSCIQVAKLWLIKRTSLGGGGAQEGRKTACKRFPVYPQLGKKIDTTENTHPGSIIFAGIVLAWLCPYHWRPDPSPPRACLF